MQSSSKQSTQQGPEAMATAVAVRGPSQHGGQDMGEVLDLRTAAGGVTPLMTACQEGHERTVRQILHMKVSDDNVKLRVVVHFFM